MNKRNKNKRDYFNQQGASDAENLLAQISMFMRSQKLRPGDWTLLSKLINQLNVRKTNLPRKVLRSIQTKFDAIKSEYQR